MKPALIAYMAASAIGFVASTSVQAATIGFSAANVSAQVGTPFSVDVVASFTDRPTIGGGLDVTFDSSLLQFNSFTFETGVGSVFPQPFVANSFALRTPDALTGKLEGIGVGVFSGVINAQGILGHLSFTPLAAGDSQLTVAVTTSAIGGGSWIADDFTSVIPLQPDSFAGQRCDLESALSAADERCGQRDADRWRGVCGDGEQQLCL